MSLSRFPISLSFVLAFVEFAKVCLPFAGESRCFRSYWTLSLCVVERLRSTRIKVSHCFCVNPRRCHCAPIACDPPDLLPSLKVDICHCPGRLTESGTSSSRRNALVGDWAGAAIQPSGNSRLSRRRKLPSAGPCTRAARAAVPLRPPSSAPTTADFEISAPTSLGQSLKTIQDKHGRSSKVSTTQHALKLPPWLLHQAPERATTT